MIFIGVIKLINLLNESRKRFNSKTVIPGEIYDESDVYSYVQRIHSNEEDFDTGDLGQRIEHYKRYKIEIIDISKLNLDRFQIYPDVVNKYIKQYKKYGVYLPIVTTDDYEIIDGNHRATALNELGINKILGFVGMKNK